ncbi:hypothetical protein [Burkholderia cenocepacia]|uniref:hypothetical protein n=1 Tax=Burkholderia cenocepacia TaxID=95486 RepID=UPI002AB6827D|nr:hypothetical protein [Burkholderia cenocepacia]
MNRLMKFAVKGLVAAAFVGPAGDAVADDSYGCKVVLCILNPNGPWDEKTQCAPAMDRLMDDLFHGRGWPGCSGSGMDLKQVWSPFDPCPDGTREAGRGQWVIQGTRKPGGDGTGFMWQQSERNFNLTGKPERSYGGDYGTLGVRLACVGNQAGSFVTYLQGSGGSGGNGYRDDMDTLFVYDRVVWQEPQNPWAFDVFMKGALTKRVHMR